MRKKTLIMAAALFMTAGLSACGQDAGSAAASASDSAASVSELSVVESSVSGSSASESSASGSSAAESTNADSSASEVSAAGKGIHIVTTIFPEYDWVREILGDNPAGAEVSMLLDNGVDLHSYQPTAEDILNISNCDLFIYVGGESDEWVEDALKEAVNPDMIVVNLLDALGDQVREEEIVEGMQADEEHEHEGEETGEHEDEEAGEHEDEEAEEHEHEEGEADEHVWLSLRNASILCDTIGEALTQLDPEHAEVYETNKENYQKALDELDANYEEAVAQAEIRTLLFGDRFPFRYLTEDYGLDYYAAFAGCSAETEASFETITFLAGKADELSLSHVCTIEGSDHRIAETIIQSTKSRDQTIVTLDSMQSATSEDAAGGVTYLSVMEKNLEALKEAVDAN